MGKLRETTDPWTVASVRERDRAQRVKLRKERTVFLVFLVAAVAGGCIAFATTSSAPTSLAYDPDANAWQQRLLIEYENLTNLSRWFISVQAALLAFCSILLTATTFLPPARGWRKYALAFLCLFTAVGVPVIALITAATR